MGSSEAYHAQNIQDLHARSAQDLRQEMDGIRNSLRQNEKTLAMLVGLLIVLLETVLNGY